MSRKRRCKFIATLFSLKFHCHSCWTHKKQTCRQKDSALTQVRMTCSSSCCGLSPFYPATSTSSFGALPESPPKGLGSNQPFWVKEKLFVLLLPAAQRDVCFLQVFKFLPQYLLTYPNVDLCFNKVSKEVEQYTIVIKRMVHYCWSQFASENNQRTFMRVITTGTQSVQSLKWKQCSSGRTTTFICHLNRRH